MIESKKNNFSIGKEVLKAARWYFVSQVVRYGSGFASVVILARYLKPEEYGLAAIAVGITAFFSVLTQFGFAPAIVGVKDISKKFIDTIFSTSLFIGISLYTFLFFTAPLFSKWYHNPQLFTLLRVGGFILLFSILMAIPLALLQRKLRYKAQANMEVGISVVGAVTGILLAVNGYGVWALVLPSLLKSILGTILGCLMSGYLPSLYFELAELRKARNFGLSAFVSNISNFFCNTAAVPIILGRIWSPAMLGFYSFAHSKHSLAFDFIAGLFTNNLFPILSRISDDRERMRKVFLRLIRLGLFIVLPMYILIILSAPVLFPIIFGDQWNMAVLPFQIMCIFLLVRAFSLGSNLVLYAQNKPQISARIVVWRVVGFAIVVAISFYLNVSLLPVVIMLLVVDSLVSMTYFIYALKELQGGYAEYINSIKVPSTLALIMLVIYFISSFLIKAVFPMSSLLLQFLVAGFLAILIYQLLGLRPLLAEWHLIRTSLKSS